MAENMEKQVKKPNFFKRMGTRIANFWREYTSEMKKVVWMSWSDVRKNALLVIVASVALSAVIGLLDFGVSNLITALGSIY
jgi:preprotein translocase SecE subunit